MLGNFKLVWNLIPILVATGLVCWGLWCWLKASDEPLVLIVRWIASIVVLGGVLGFAARAHDEMSKIAAILVGAVGGLVMTLIWRQKFCDFVGDLFASLYTGGNQQVEPTPFYSIANAKRKQGKPDEALVEVRTQLGRFPTDFTGWMLLAEIYAEDKKDLAGAKAILEELLAQDGHAPKNIAFALNREADWHLKLAQDRDGARLALERIVQTLPDTEQAQLARQRIAHLTPTEMLKARQEPRLIPLQQGEDSVGLRLEPLDLAPREEDPEAAAARLIERLTEHPFDDEAREKLALLYARHYRRLDLATEQLEQLIAAPNQPPKHVVRWLNLLSDLQIAAEGSISDAKRTLQRLIELYPNSAAAENASHRIAHLNLELRPQQQRAAVRLGSYEQNIGLKRGHFGPGSPGAPGSVNG